MKKIVHLKERGMTLIEILVVIMLIALCSLWSLQGWKSYQQSMLLEQNAQRLRLYLTELQAEANAYNRTVILWAIEGAGGCVGVLPKPDECHSQQGVSHFEVSEPSIEVLDFTDKVMGFYGIRNAAQAGHITLKNAAGSLRIVLSTRGRLRICSEVKAMLGLAQCQ